MNYEDEEREAIQNEPTADGHPLLAVMRHVGGIQKDKRNAHAGYDYLSEEAVKRAVQHGLTASGVAPDGITYEVISDEWIDGKKGRQNLCKVRAALRFGDRVYEGLGSGIDYGDKALLKAQTSAIREAWKTALVIPSGNDPEADRETDSDTHAAAPPRQGGNHAERRVVHPDTVLRMLAEAVTREDIREASEAFTSCKPTPEQRKAVRDAAEAAKARVDGAAA